MLGDKEGGVVCYAYAKLYPGKIKGMIISNFVSPMKYKIKNLKGGKIKTEEAIENYHKLVSKSQKCKKIQIFRKLCKVCRNGCE